MVSSEVKMFNDSVENMICITIDIEWSPDELIDVVIKTLDEHKVKATFFATHKVSIKGHEIALHPNYTSTDTYRDTITKLRNLFPDAKGVRGHRCATDEMLLTIYQELGILYQSAYLMLGMKNIHPFNLEFNVVEMPLYYMDRIHVEEPRYSKNGFSIKALDLSSPGLKVFAFHPIHIFLNTNKIETYRQAKKHYHEPKLLEQYRNKEREGIGTLFNELLENIADNGTKTYMLLEIYNKYSKSLNKKSI